MSRAHLHGLATGTMLLVGLAALPALAQPAKAPGVTTAPAAASRTASPYRPLKGPDSTQAYYQSLWGADNFLVQLTASGSLVRFSYRVVDPARAATLNDERLSPQLIDPERGVSLEIPSLEKVGKLRQKGTPVAGKVYWMVFSNKGFPVKAGDRVNVVIGNFRADGLVVE